jgi:hypothetical protein
MALWPLFTVPDCIQYGTTFKVMFSTTYNQFLILPPRIYPESIASIVHWYYSPGWDRLCLWVMLDTCQWPGWAVRRYDFDAATGALLGQYGQGWGPVAWVNNGSLGSYGVIYATWSSNSSITQMNPDTMWPDAGMWSINPGQWSPGQFFTHALVNREDGLIVGVSSWTLEIWEINGTPTRRASFHLPYTLGYLAYESRDIAWIITKNGLVGKMNYRLNPARWEMLSSVQNPAPDALDYCVAFDPKRKRLAVFRWRPDAEDGACQCQLEFYRPLYKVAGLTDPVPVSRLRAGERPRFVAHLYGENGEGVSAYLINAALQEPAAGSLLASTAAADLCGAATFRYQAPVGEAAEKLMLSATITDGE